jgi:hypothetical protein
MLASSEIDSFRASGIQRDFLRVRLRWTDPTTGESQELVQGVTVRFSTDSRDMADNYNFRVYRAAVASVISQVMQDAIEQIDRSGYRRSERALRRARNRARDINYAPDDSEIGAMIARLDRYIAEAGTRGMSALDFKILRSGLFDQFDVPIADEEEAGK